MSRITLTTLVMMIALITAVSAAVPPDILELGPGCCLVYSGSPSYIIRPNQSMRFACVECQSCKEECSEECCYFSLYAENPEGCENNAKYYLPHLVYTGNKYFCTNGAFDCDATYVVCGKMEDGSGDGCDVQYSLGPPIFGDSCYDPNACPCVTEEIEQECLKELVHRSGSVSYVMIHVRDCVCPHP